MLHKSLFKSFGLRFGQGEGLAHGAFRLLFIISLKRQPKAGLEILFAFTLTIAEYFARGKFSSPSVLPSCLAIFICNALEVLPT